jgi:hypothetical protein
MNDARQIEKICRVPESTMKLKPVLFAAFVLGALFVSTACDAFPGGGDNNARPTPTLPFPTPIVVATTAPGQPTAQGQQGLSIGGNVFNDSNANGARDAGEPLIAGVIVQIAAGECPGTLLAQTTSTVNTPSYKFPGMNAGTYCVAVDASSPQNAAILGPGEWTVPENAQGIISESVTLGNESFEDISFGWTFATIGQVTPNPEEPTAEPGQPTPVPILPTPTTFVQPTGAPQACTYRANFIQDVTIPDRTLIAPGAQFVKTWRVLNSGTCPWGPGSGVQNLQFTGGNALGAPNLVPIPNAVPAGATTDLSINMVAPTDTGTYFSNWKLRANDGTLIGVGPRNVALFASIRVQAAPAPTNVPPPTNPPPAQAIHFAPGATEADVQAQLPANQIATYSLSASANQNMQLTLSSNSASARLAVISPAGVPLPPQRGNPEGTYWQGNLPANGTYLIQVLAGNATPVANFGLNVTIPVRITFAPGAISAQVQGVTSSNRVVTYLLKANGGQTMIANLTAPPESAGITIYGLEDGQPLIRSQSGATSFNGPLPATQDYVIQVVPFGSTQVNYTLDITVR